MAERRLMVAGSGMDPLISPDELAIPAEPEVLRQAIHGLREIAQTLSSAGDKVGGGGDDGNPHGETASTVSDIAERNGRRASRDAAKIEEIATAADHMADVVSNIQSHDLPSIRHRWAQARETFRAAVSTVAVHQEWQGVGASPDPNPGLHPEKRIAAPGPGMDLHAANSYIKHMEDDLIEPHEKILIRMIGRYNIRGNLGDHQSREFMLTNHHIQEAAGTFRHTVAGLLNEYSDHAHRAIRLENEIRDKARREEMVKGSSQGFVAAGGGDTISGPRVLRHLVHQMRDLAQAYDNGHDRFDNACRHLIEGMLPDREGHADNSFVNEWRDYLARRRHRLRTVCQKVDDVVDELLRIDAQCARALLHG